MFDSHLHTKYSYDSTMTIEAAARAAKDLSIGIVVTDHMDILEESVYHNKGKKSSIFDMDAYFEEYLPYRSERLLIGVELGLIPSMAVVNQRLADRYPLDFVLGSIHRVGRKGIGAVDFFEHKSKKEVYTDYLKCIIENLHGCDFIDSLAHMDFICRYATYEDVELRYSEFPELLSEIFKLLVQKDIALEINTKRLMDKQAALAIGELCRCFAQHGGHFVTIGSDAHLPGYIGRNRQVAWDIAQSCGLKVVHFKDRDPVVEV